MKYFNKAVAIIISVLMAVSAMPITALADYYGESEYKVVDYSEYGAEFLEEGTTCSGENDICSWSYNGITKTLYLDGEVINSAQQLTEYGNVYYTYLLPAFNVVDDENGKYLEYCPMNIEKIIFSNNVLRIGFVNLRLYRDTLNEVEFEEGSQLKVIDNRVFHYTHITEIDLPDTVEYIGDECFSYTDLYEINFPSGLTTVKRGAFQHCQNLTSLDFTNTNIENIETYAFSNCDNLTSVTLSNKIRRLSGFDFCDSLHSIDIPSSVYYIGEEAFAGLTLDNIELPEGVQDIGIYAFYKTKCDNISFPSTLTHISYNAFDESEITVFDFSNNNNAVTFGHHCFCDCKNIEAIILPKNTTVLSENMFNGSNIASLAIPANVTTIKDNCFIGAAIGSLTFEKGSKLDTIGNKAFYNVNISGKVTFPKQCKNFGSDSFRGATIDTVDFPASVESFGLNSFIDANINTVIVRGRETRLGTTTGSNVLTAESVIVGYPESTAQQYADYYGITFTDIAEYDIDPTEPDESTDKSTYGIWSGGEWIFDEDMDTLVISGSGALSVNMTTAGGRTYKFVDYIKSKDVDTLKIKNGITSIPDNCFYSASAYNLYAVRLPDTLVSVGSNAFKGAGVGEISFKSGLQSIGNNAFEGAAIKRLTIPESVTSIGSFAFANCESLNTVNISEGITEISEGAFYNTAVTEVTIPESVAMIDKKAFGSCISLTKINIQNPDTVIYSDDVNKQNNAFGFDANGNVINHTERIKKQNSSSSYMTYGFETQMTVNAHFNSNAFDYAEQFGLVYFNEYENGDACGITNVYEKSRWIYKADTKTLYLMSQYSIGDTVYQSLTNPNEYVSADKGLSFMDNEGNAVETPIADKIVVCSGVKKINILLSQIDPIYVKLPETLEVFLKNGCFAGSKRLKTITIPDSVTILGSNIFKGCESLVSVKLGTTISDYAFAQCSSLKNIDYGNINYIAPYAFYNCGSLSEINLPSNVKCVGSHAFDKCVGVKKIVLNDGLEEICAYAFSRCPFLATVVMNCSTLNDYDKINANAYAQSGFSTTGIDLVVGDTVKTAYLYNLSAMNVTSIHIGRSLTDFTISEEWSTLKTITVDENNKNFSVYKNCLYKGTVLTLVPPQYTVVDIKSDTTEIGYGAFMCSNVVSLTLPNKVKKIGDSAFSGCKNLKRINLDDSLRSVGDWAFDSCDKLRTITFPSLANSIGVGCFYGCTSLSSVILPNYITKIKGYTFAYCYSLHTIIIPELVNTVEDYAFEKCTGLENVLSYTVTKFESVNAFSRINKSQLTFYTVVGSGAVTFANDNNYNLVKYSTRTAFKNFCDEMLDAEQGYLGFCTEGHGDTEYLTVYLNDCENDGYVIGVCEYCSEIVEEIHTDANGHSYTTTLQTEPTATTKGIIVHTCTVCGESFTDYIDALDGEFVKEMHTVSGTIVIANSKTEETGKTPAKRADIIIDNMTVATTDNNGNFSFAIESGTYAAQIKYAFGYTRNIAIVVEDEDIAYSNAIPVVGVDFNKDGKVDNEDLEMFNFIISSKANDPGYLDFVDMNNDGYINATDLLVIRQFLGTDFATYEYPSLTIQKQ